MKTLILCVFSLSLLMGCSNRRHTPGQVGNIPPQGGLPPTTEDEAGDTVADTAGDTSDTGTVVAEADTAGDTSDTGTVVPTADTVADTAGGTSDTSTVVAEADTADGTSDTGTVVAEADTAGDTSDTGTVVAEADTVADTAGDTSTVAVAEAEAGSSTDPTDSQGLEDPLGDWFEDLNADPRSITIEDIENSAKVARHNRIGLNANEIYARMQTMPPGLSQEEVDTYWESWRKEGKKISGEEHDVRLAAYQWYRLLNQPPALKWIGRLMDLNPRIPDYVTLHEEFKYFLSKLLLDYKYTHDEVETIPVQSLRTVYHCRVTPNTIRLDDPDLRPSLYVLTEHYELETDKHRCILDVVDHNVLHPMALGDYEDDDYPKWKTIISSDEAPFSCREAMQFIIEKLSRREYAKGVPGPYEDYGYRVCEHLRVLFKVDGEYKSLLGPN